MSENDTLFWAYVLAFLVYKHLVLILVHNIIILTCVACLLYSVYKQSSVFINDNGFKNGYTKITFKRYVKYGQSGVFFIKVAAASSWKGRQFDSKGCLKSGFLCKEQFHICPQENKLVYKWGDTDHYYIILYTIC